MFRIKDLIKEKGITQEVIAERVGMKRESLSRIINGNPTISSLQKIADVLEVEIVDLFERSSTGLNGFVEFNSEVYTIRNVDDLRSLLDRVEGEESKND